MTRLADYSDDNEEPDITAIVQALAGKPASAPTTGKECEDLACTARVQDGNVMCSEHCRCTWSQKATVGSSCPECGEFKRGSGIPPRPDGDNVELHWVCYDCDYDYTTNDECPRENRTYDSVYTSGYNYGDTDEGMFSATGKDGMFILQTEYEQDSEDWCDATDVDRQLVCPQCGSEADVRGDGSVLHFVVPKWYDEDEQAYVT